MFRSTFRKYRTLSLVLIEHERQQYIRVRVRESRILPSWRTRILPLWHSQPSIDHTSSTHPTTSPQPTINHVPFIFSGIVRLMGRVVVNHACECSLYKVGPKDALTSVISTVNYTDSDGAIEFGDLRTLSYSSEKMRSHNPFSELWLYFCPF